MEEHSESTDDKGKGNIIVSYQERIALEAKTKNSIVSFPSQKTSKFCENVCLAIERTHFGQHCQQNACVGLLLSQKLKIVDLFLIRWAK